MTKKNNNTRRGNRVSGSSTRTDLGAGGVKPILRGNPRKMIYSTRDGIRVVNKESVNYLISGPSSVLKGYDLIGGLFTRLPWFSGLAKNYSKFHIHSLKISYAPVAPTTQTGDVVLAWVPDVNDASAWTGHVSTETIFNYPYWVAGPCYGGTTNSNGDGTMSISVPQGHIHSSMPWFYVGQTGEILTHYGGAIINQLGSNGSGSGKACGRIFLEYDIELVQSQSNQDLSLKSNLPETGRRSFPDPNLPPMTPPSPLPSPTPEPQE